MPDYGLDKGQPLLVLNYVPFGSRYIIFMRSDSENKPDETGKYESARTFLPIFDTEVGSDGFHRQKLKSIMQFWKLALN